MKGKTWIPASRKAKKPPAQALPSCSLSVTCRSPLVPRPETATRVQAGEERAIGLVCLLPELLICVVFVCSGVCMCVCVGWGVSVCL